MLNWNFLRYWPDEAPANTNLAIRRRTPQAGPGFRHMLAGLAGFVLLLTLLVTGSVWLLADDPWPVLDSVGSFALFTVLPTGLWVIGAELFVRQLSEPAQPGVANTPLQSWKSDRTLQLVRTGFGGLFFGPMPGLVIAALNGFTMEGVALGLFIGLAGIQLIAFQGKHHAWFAYVFAIRRLSREGKLPRDLMYFLDDCHRLGLLRAVGPIYQFRHAALQDRLAEKYQRSPLTP